MYPQTQHHRHCTRESSDVHADCTESRYHRAMRGIDFNADLGEGFDDAALIPWISSANVACGAHAGDTDTMRRTLLLCRDAGVAVGAHPGYSDRAHFGRREHALEPGDVAGLVLRQLDTLAQIAGTCAVRLHHVKPHGALYNQAARDPAVARAIVDAIRAHDSGLIVYGLSGSVLCALAQQAGLAVAHEVFAERRYASDGKLLPRDAPGAVIEHLDEAIAQVRQLLESGSVTAADGSCVALRVDTVCLHGDRADAASFAQALRQAIEAAGMRVRAPA